MANTGLPVCANKMRYSPIKLITSMRTSDSLAEESSYFYAEIMRLRYIVEQMKDQEYFIILDEILKGTNSKDKALGSRKFIERLVRSGSTGIIATHDLSLCDIEKLYPQIQNKFFDAKIIKEELFFDYKLKDGICTNMNASFLLKKMEII
jgi:DNA mismatch repair ATPase MutS